MQAPVEEGPAASPPECRKDTGIQEGMGGRELMAQHPRNSEGTGHPTTQPKCKGKAGRCHQTTNELSKRNCPSAPQPHQPRRQNGSQMGRSGRKSDWHPSCGWAASRSLASTQGVPFTGSAGEIGEPQTRL